MQEIFCDHLCLMTLKIWFYLFEIFYFLFSFFFWCLFYKWVIWNKSCWILDNKACFYFLCVHQTQLYIQSPLNSSAQDNTAVCCQEKSSLHVRTVKVAACVVPLIYQLLHFFFLLCWQMGFLCCQLTDATLLMAACQECCYLMWATSKLHYIPHIHGGENACCHFIRFIWSAHSNN